MTPELVIHTPGARRVSLGEKPLTLGRASDCDVTLADDAVSRRHCRLTPGRDGWTVEDLGSSGGTFVDGVRADGPTPFPNGSWLGLGNTAIQLVTADEPALVLSGEPTHDAHLLRQLLGAIADFAATDDLDEVLGAIVDRGIRVASGERGALFLAGDGDDLEVVVARDLERGVLPLDQVLTRTLPRRALRGNRPVVLADAGAGDDELPQSLADTNRQSVICVPLPGADGPRGVLYLDSRQPVTSFGTPELAVLATLAAHASLAIDRAEESRRAARRHRRLEAENAVLRSRLGEAPIAACEAMRHTLELLRKVAPAEAPVCLVGETGTGKEVLARYLHRLSPRAAGPFVVVDCGALPETLIESELFGHERGAFTGAAGARPGRLREAVGGTVFLDEVGELPLALQTRLLRFVQEQVVKPLGGREVKVDARVVCATHRDLEAMVRDGTFREDLYYRLGVLTLEVPPLRSRGDDVLLLAEHFLARLQEGAAQPVQGFSRDAREALLAHAWPGNVRELEHRVQRGVLLAPSPYVTRHDLGLGGEPAADDDDGLLPLQEARARAGERFERAYLEEVLRLAKGSITQAAELAGVSRQAIHALVQRHGIDRQRFS